MRALRGPARVIAVLSALAPLAAAVLLVGADPSGTAGRQMDEVAGHWAPLTGELASVGFGPGLLLPALPSATRPAEFDPGRCGFAVAVRELENPFRTLAVFALPGERLDLRVIDPGERRFRLEADGLPVAERFPGRWTWQAPAASGLHRLRIVEEGSGAAMSLPTFVMVPATEMVEGTLNGYRIGRYPSTPLRGLDIYRPPAGFVEVPPELARTPVSPHFTLGQFLCKEEAGWPRYLALQEKLLLKLEHLLERVNAHGTACPTFAVLSGFRTPLYNRALGNSPYSRHLWGGAADIYVDADRDGVMDDLDGNGRVGLGDATVLCELVEGLVGEPEFASLDGGLGRYPRSGAHGPFVHVDVRGFPARWGI